MRRIRPAGSSPVDNEAVVAAGLAGPSTAGSPRPCPRAPPRPVGLAEDPLALRPRSNHGLAVGWGATRWGCAPRSADVLVVAHSGGGCVKAAGAGGSVGLVVVRRGAGRGVHAAPRSGAYPSRSSAPAVRPPQRRGRPRGDELVLLPREVERLVLAVVIRMACFAVEGLDLAAVPRVVLHQIRTRRPTTSWPTARRGAGGGGGRGGRLLRALRRPACVLAAPAAREPARSRASGGGARRPHEVHRHPFLEVAIRVRDRRFYRRL